MDPMACSGVVRDGHCTTTCAGDAPPVGDHRRPADARQSHHSRPSIIGIGRGPASLLLEPLVLACSSRPRPARHVARADRTASALPTLCQKPASRPVHDERIIRRADWPHQRLVLQLLPVGEQDSRTERIHQPRRRDPLAILSVLPPVVEDVG